MRLLTLRRYTVRGRFGDYLVPTVQAVDARLRTLLGLLPVATPDGAGRIREDIDVLLDWRNSMTAVTGQSRARRL